MTPPKAKTKRPAANGGDVTVRVQPAVVDLTTSSFGHYAKDYFAAYTAYQPPVRFSPARFFLLCRSIELAAKGLHFAAHGSVERLLKLGHRLAAACDAVVLRQHGVTLTTEQRAELSNADRYYAGKGFEYLIFKERGTKEPVSQLRIALKGWPGLPDEAVLQSVLQLLLPPAERASRALGPTDDRTQPIPSTTRRSTPHEDPTTPRRARRKR